MDLIIWGIGIGIIAALLRVAVGFLKSNKETFELPKAGKTLLLAIILGGITGAFYPLPLEQLFAVVFLETVSVQELLQGIVRRI